MLIFAGIGIVVVDRRYAFHCLRHVVRDLCFDVMISCVSGNAVVQIVAEKKLRSGPELKDKAACGGNWQFVSSIRLVDVACWKN